MISDPLFYAAAVPAVILVGLAKGGLSGLGVLALPLMALVAPPVQAAAILLPILIVQDAVSLYAYWGKWDRRNLAVLLPGALTGVLLAYLLAAYVSEAGFGIALGAISIVFALRHLVGAAPARPSRPSSVLGVWWGLAAGFTSTIAHAGGPPFQIYVMPQQLPRETFVGTGVAFFSILNAVKVVPFLALGGFSSENLGTAAALLPLAVLATLSGVLIVQRVSAERFYRIVYFLLILVGLQLAWRDLATLT